MYAKHLFEVGKLIYLIGNYKQTAIVKKVLQSSDGKSKIFYKCAEETPKDILKKIKYSNTKEGIIRADWLNKMVQRYPEMVIFVFNCGQDTLELQKVEIFLKDMLRKVNIFYADTLKAHNKEDIIIRIVVTLSKLQFNNSIIQQKVLYYLKTYEKDVFIVQTQTIGKEISKYRNSWLSYLQKNYQRKLKKIIKKYQESNIIQKRINYSFKIAILSQILNRDEKKSYQNLFHIIKLRFSQITKKEFNFLKYLEIKEIRAIADTAIIRFIKFKIEPNTKEIPKLINDHINFFKMRSMEPTSCHFFFYYEELIWRIGLFQSILEVFYQTEIMQFIPKVFIAQLLNGLLTYLHKVCTTNGDMLKDHPGQKIKYLEQVYIGKMNYNDITDGEMIITGITNIIDHKNDYISKGIQLINHYTTNSIFKENQKNFLNIFLIRFLLASGNGKINEKISVYNQIIKLEMNRNNYFLINELFNEIKQEINSIDNSSKALLYAVASLICDFFQNKQELQHYLTQFFRFLTYQKQTPSLFNSFPQEQSSTLFDQQSVNQFHAFKLKRSSSILMVRIGINEQLILSEESYKITVKMFIHEIVRQKMRQNKSKIRLHFNHANMICLLDVQLNQNDNEIVERQFVIEPLVYLRKDAILKIEEIHLVLEKNNLAFVLDRNQIFFEKYDSTLFYCKIEEPQIIIESQRKVYYLNETAYFHIIIRGIQGCKATSKFSISQEQDGKTEFFMNYKERKDLTNSKITPQLVISQDMQHRNVCWIKSNRIGAKSLKLQFTSTVQKTFQVGWREKPLNLKSTYSTTKEINFNVSNLFTITKLFREAPTGNLFDNNIPINKKTLLCYYIKTAQNILIKELGHHNNPNSVKIKYYKNIKITNAELKIGENLKVSVLFQLTDDCQHEFQLFLTTLFIKWRRIQESIPIDNVYLDNETLVNAISDKALVTFQINMQIYKKQKASLAVSIQNLTKQSMTAFVLMESTEYLLRIGEKSKLRQIEGLQRCQIVFDILCTHGGIFDFPQVRVFLNDVQVKVSTKNILVYCS